MSKTVAYVQARMSSKRFPGKVLAELRGLPLVVFMVQRVRRAKTLDDVMVITSTDPSDDTLAETMGRFGIRCFRGNLTDVLARYAAAVAKEGTSEVVRLTADCPLADPELIDKVVCARRDTGSDYASNIDPPTYPDGLDVECFTAEAIARAHREAQQPYEREHVTPWMRSDASRLTRVNCPAVADLSSLRLTVDYPEDLAAVREIVDGVMDHPQFDMFDMLRCLSRRPDILRMNSRRRRPASVDGNTIES